MNVTKLNTNILEPSVKTSTAAVALALAGETINI